MRAARASEPGHEVRPGARFCEECGKLFPAGPASEQRKTVTIVFCDLTGSTALGESSDPEPPRALLARYIERMKGAVEFHGGTAAKFIGDAVMAVFGIPHAHEDDALRAVRAASGMRAALPELGLQGRIGLTTGEAVTENGGASRDGRCGQRRGAPRAGCPPREVLPPFGRSARDRARPLH
jgi:class 3 adenylate cyclase